MKITIRLHCLINDPRRLTAGTCPHGGLVPIMFLSKWVMTAGSMLIFQGVIIQPLGRGAKRAADVSVANSPQSSIEKTVQQPQNPEFCHEP